MRIAVFYNISFSGAKRVVKEQVKGLRKLGNEIDIYTTDKENDIFDPKPYANKTFIYDYSPMKLKIPIIKRIKSDFYDTFYKLRKLHKQIANEIDNRKYDLVLVHIDTFTQAPFVLRYLSTKKVYFCLEPLRNVYEYQLRLKGNYSILNKFYEEINRWLRKQIDRNNTLSCDHILTISLFARERIIASYGLYPEISYIGVDQNKFKKINSVKKNQILFVADKDPIYGFDFAQKAIMQIPKKIRPLLKTIVWQKNNDLRLADEEIINEYSSSIATLSLSKFDTFGLVALESLSCETPVIAFNVAGYREIIEDGKNGFLVEFDSGDLANKIIYFLQNRKITEKMGKEGRSDVLKKWTWDYLNKALEGRLIEFVKGR